MEDWTAGYVADLGYTYGYYPELNPLAVRMALQTAGVAAPAIRTACELGFGQGMSVNLHAAASDTRWWGTDFNPAQAGFAQQLSTAAGSEAQLCDEAFEEFCRRDDLPQFDYIGLHGIWSWINDMNRGVIVDFLRRKLKVGGVLYVSYNTQPGWADAVPLRDLLSDHVDVMSSSGQGLVSRIDAAIAFAQKLMDTEPRFAKANPMAAQRLKRMATQDRHYLAHEYFNRDWEPMSFARMARWLAPAKLNFGCSANMLDQVDSAFLTPAQQALVKDIPDPVFRQSVRDFCVNQQFRKDYWVKGARSLNRLEHHEALRDLRVVLCMPAGDVKLKEGDPNVNEAAYQPVLQVLSDHKPRTLGQIADQLQPQGLGLIRVARAAILLASKHALLPAQSDAAVEQARGTTARLNKHLMLTARGTQDIGYLASPLTGGGVPVGRFAQMLLLARAAGEKTPEDWARSAWRDLSVQGQRLAKDGKVLQTPEENLAELTRQAREFAEKRLPLLQALQVV